MYSQVLAQQPFTSVATLAEAKTQCRVTHTFEDDYISALINVACEMAQNYTNRQITESTCAIVVESYQTEIQLPFGEVTSVSEVLLDGEETTDFEFNEITQKLTITSTLNFSKVKATYECGFTTVPAAVKQGVLMLVSTLYNNRQDIAAGLTVSEIPMTSKTLLNTVKYYGI